MWLIKKPIQKLIFLGRGSSIILMILSRKKAISTTVAAGIVIIIIVVAGAGVLLAYPGILAGGSSTSSSQNKTFKILLFNNVPATTSWGVETTRGLQQASAALNRTDGFNLKVTYAYNVAYGDGQSFMQSYASQGYNLIIAQDAGFASAVSAVAPQFPNVQFFVCCAPQDLARNVAVWGGDHWKGEFMAGVLAGLMTKTNTIGLVTSFQFDQTVEAINAFYAGAKHTNPNVKIIYNFAQSWSDSVKGASAAQALAAQGADVIAGFGNGLSDGVVNGAKQAGVFAIGYLHDASSLAPQTVLTSIMLNSTEYYVKAIQAAEVGQIGFKSYVLEIYPDKVAYLTTLTNVPSNVMSQVTPILQQVTNGQLVPPTNTTLPTQGQ